MSGSAAFLRPDGLHGPALEAGILGLARDMVRSLNVALRTVRFHDPGNEAAVQALDNLTTVVNDLFRVTGSYTLKILGDYLFWNDSRLKADAGTYAAFDSLVKEFKGKGIGSLTVCSSVSRDEVRALVTILASAPAVDPEEDPDRAEATLRFLSERLAAATRSFVLGPHQPYEANELEKEQIDHKERAKKTFFRAVAVTRAVMTSAKLNNQMDLWRAKRVVQTMVDLILEEEFGLLGLTTIKEYDSYTFHHSVNVCVLSIAIGKRVGLDKKRLSELGVAALFHDIGKTEIPTQVLRKPGKFDKDEWELMKAHPVFGVRVLVRLKGFSDLAMKSVVVAFEHHLGMNLSGYPRLLEPRDLHLTSRIVTIADCFDAMTTARVYNQAATPRDKALSYMLSQSGRLFDPALLKVFVNLIGVYPIGCLVRLDTDQLAVVLSTRPDGDPKRPRIKVVTDASGIEIDGPEVDLGVSGDYEIVSAVDPSSLSFDTSRYFL